MNLNCFYILKGNSRATYIFNISDANCINNSLKFYKAKTNLSRLKKWILKVYLNLLVLVKTKSLKNPDQINAFLQSKVNVDIDFDITKNCSILIAPTEDKVIVHHHGKYYHKFAFGKSYSKVLNEQEIYNLISKPKHFTISKLYDLLDDKQLKYCEFKLKTGINKVEENVIDYESIINALVEFFQINSVKKTNLNEYVSNLIERVKHISFDNIIGIEGIANKIILDHKNFELPLGLVHRDFKPWNIINQEKLLIYDFEEVVLNGPPLEDMFNYYIDPKINYTSSRNLYRSVISKDKISVYNQYLTRLDINVNFSTLLFIYLLERIVFWSKLNQEETAKSYKVFLNYLIHKNQFVL